MFTRMAKIASGDMLNLFGYAEWTSTDERAMPACNRGRQAGTEIRNSRILGNLIKHAEGEREMTSSEVRAALDLLKKALPDLSSTALKTEEGPLTVHFTTVYEAPPEDRKGVSAVQREPSVSEG